MAQRSPLEKQLSGRDRPGEYLSEDIALAAPAASQGGRPVTIKHVSAPTYQSPLRHHQRTASNHRQVKETLNARSEYSNSEDDGTAEHRINQYMIKQEIGRGSFGAVHLAVDQYGHEYAVKEFSKSRLRKRAQSNLLRRPDGGRKPGVRAPGRGFNSPLHRHSSDDVSNNSLDLIREEIAIMKKLNHPNLVSLIEVLDDPEEDSLYMVLELCKKGVVMKVGLDERADPYTEEECRCWFRDMILGIEYLHEQGVVHRDIKPDNCLVTDEDVLKFVDFGVSEMFEKESAMNTKKSAGSPAFMPPELCVAKHGEVSGRAADIWSMGVTLYCLRHGRIPFEKPGVLDLYESIRNDPLEIADDCSEDLKDLLQRILEKDPEKRIRMEELREHQWVTVRGADPLLSHDANVAVILEPPTEEELDAAITGTMGHLMVVMKAVKRFKELLAKRRPELMGGIFGRASRIVQPPLSMSPTLFHRRARSTDTDDRRPIERVLATEGVHREIPIDDQMKKLPREADEMITSTSDEAPVQSPQTEKPTGPTMMGKAQQAMTHPSQYGETSDVRKETKKGHAHDPLEDTLFLQIGAGTNEETLAQIDGDYTVSESPSAVDINVYETAYQEQVRKILETKGRSATLYLTRRVEHNKELREHKNIVNGNTSFADASKTKFSKLIERARAANAQPAEEGETKTKDEASK